MRIAALDKRNFPIAFPVFEAFLTLNGALYLIVRFDIDERLDAMRLREPVDNPFFVLVNAPDNVIGYADIKRSSRLTGENVNVVSNGARLA